MLRTDEGLPLKYLLPEALPLLERYRSLELADVSAEQCLILKGPRPPAGGRHRRGIVLS